MGALSFAFFAKGGIPHLQTQWDFDLGGAFDLSRPLRRLRPNCLYHPIHDHLPHLPPSLLCRDVHCWLLSSSSSPSASTSSPSTSSPSPSKSSSNHCGPPMQVLCTSPRSITTSVASSASNSVFRRLQLAVCSA